MPPACKIGDRRKKNSGEPMGNNAALRKAGMYVDLRESAEILQQHREGARLEPVAQSIPGPTDATYIHIKQLRQTTKR